MMVLRRGEVVPPTAAEIVWFIRALAALPAFFAAYPEQARVSVLRATAAVVIVRAW